MDSAVQEWPSFPGSASLNDSRGIIGELVVDKLPALNRQASNEPELGLLTPSGGTFDPYRARSAGVLTDEEIAVCKRLRIPLSYDCAQIGWVAATCEDDLAYDDDQREDLYSKRRSLVQSLFALCRQVSREQLSRDDAEKRALGKIEELIGHVGAHNLEEADQLYLSLRLELARYLSTNLGEVDTSSSEFCYRRWTPDDVQDYRRIFGNEDVWKHLPDDAPGQISVDVAEALILASNNGSHHDVFAVQYNQAPVGQIRLLYNQKYPNLRGAEVAYLLGQEDWGKGLMSKILVDFTVQSLRQRSLDFLVAWIHPDNHASIRCAERAGYVRDNFAGESLVAQAAERDGFLRYIHFSSN